MQGECQRDEVRRKWLWEKEKAEQRQCDVEHTRFGVTESWRKECDEGLAICERGTCLYDVLLHTDGGQAVP